MSAQCKKREEEKFQITARICHRKTFSEHLKSLKITSHLPLPHHSIHDDGAKFRSDHVSSIFMKFLVHIFSSPTIFPQNDDNDTFAAIFYDLIIWNFSFPTQKTSNSNPCKSYSTLEIFYSTPRFNIPQHKSYNEKFSRRIVNLTFDWDFRRFPFSRPDRRRRVYVRTFKRVQIVQQFHCRLKKTLSMRKRVEGKKIENFSLQKLQLNSIPLECNSMRAYDLDEGETRESDT